MTASLGLELPRTVEAPRLARQSLAEWVRAELDAYELDDVKLLASELTTNALVHGCGRIELHAQLDENRLLVEVIDEGQGFERIVRERHCDHVGGEGLNILDAVASRWGIHEGSSRVWFELERCGPRLGPADKPGSQPAGYEAPVGRTSQSTPPAVRRRRSPRGKSRPMMRTARIGLPMRELARRLAPYV